MTHPATYQDKLAREIEQYRGVTNVHDLPEIFDYWALRYLVPLFRAVEVRGMINEFFQDGFLESLGRVIPQGRPARFLSIGSGNSDTELEVVRALSQYDMPPFVIDCLEMNSAMQARARAAAEAAGLSRFFNFIEADFNTWVPTETYTGVMANQSLHHVLNLEHLFAQVKSALHPGGLFMISDMIGRNGHQRWPEARVVVDEFWDQLPPSYRFNRLLNRHEARFMDHDCSQVGFEGIRSQDILPLLIKTFDFDLFLGFGNVIDVFIDRPFGHHFNPAGVWDTHFIDRVAQRDQDLIDQGVLKPTHILARVGHGPYPNRILYKGQTPQWAVRVPG